MNNQVMHQNEMNQAPVHALAWIYRLTGERDKGALVRFCQRGHGWNRLCDLVAS
jgi:hypothetical protein